MKQTVISLDLEDILKMMGESTTKLFSVCSLSADTAPALCTEVRTHFSEQIRPWGCVAVRITAAPGFTLDEIQQILSSVRDHSSEDLIWGFESPPNRPHLPQGLCWAQPRYETAENPHGLLPHRHYHYKVTP